MTPFKSLYFAIRLNAQQELLVQKSISNEAELAFMSQFKFMQFFNWFEFRTVRRSSEQPCPLMQINYLS